MMDTTGTSIALLGGTGDLGSGLAYQLAKAGFHIIIGSRSLEKAEQTAAKLRVEMPGVKIDAAENVLAAEKADVVFMTVPFASHDTTMRSVKQKLHGKVFVDTTVPLVPPKVMRVQLPEGGSVARRAQQYLGDDVKVVSAFQNLAAHHLRSDRLSEVASDVLVCGDNPAARETVINIAASIGLRAWHAGPIDNSVVAEALTSVLIFLNKKYSLDGAGIRIVSNQKD